LADQEHFHQQDRAARPILRRTRHPTPRLDRNRTFAQYPSAENDLAAAHRLGSPTALKPCRRRVSTVARQSGARQVKPGPISRALATVILWCVIAMKRNRSNSYSGPHGARRISADCASLSLRRARAVFDQLERTACIWQLTAKVSGELVVTTPGSASRPCWLPVLGASFRREHP